MRTTWTAPKSLMWYLRGRFVVVLLAVGAEATPSASFPALFSRRWFDTGVGSEIRIRKRALRRHRDFEDILLILFVDADMEVAARLNLEETRAPWKMTLMNNKTILQVNNSS